MDKWYIQWRKEKARGDTISVRYADDIVYGFQYENEARSFLKMLRLRLENHKLKLHLTKTRLIEFGRFAATNRQKRNEGRPETFNFLGFTHICGKTQRGKYRTFRKTMSKRHCRKLKEVKVELKRRMHAPLMDTAKWVSSVVRGYTQYHAVPGNMQAVNKFYIEVGRMWLKVIRRRSQKARDRWTWEKFYRLQRRWIPSPRLVHPFPSVRFDAKYSR